MLKRLGVIFFALASMRVEAWQRSIPNVFRKRGLWLPREELGPTEFGGKFGEVVAAVTEVRNTGSTVVWSLWRALTLSTEPGTEGLIKSLERC